MNTVTVMIRITSPVKPEWEIGPSCLKTMEEWVSVPRVGDEVLISHDLDWGGDVEAVSFDAEYGGATIGLGSRLDMDGSKIKWLLANGWRIDT